MGETDETSSGKKKRCKRPSNDTSSTGSDSICAACGEAPCGKPCKRRHTGDEEEVVRKKAALSDDIGLTHEGDDVRYIHNENDNADPEPDANRTEGMTQEKAETVGESKSKESGELSPDAGTVGSDKDMVPGTVGSDKDPIPGGLKRKASGVEVRETKKVRISEDIQIHSAHTDVAGQTTKRHRHRQKAAAKELPELRVIPK